MSRKQGAAPPSGAIWAHWINDRPGSVEETLGELDRVSIIVEALKRAVLEERADWYRRAQSLGFDR